MAGEARSIAAHSDSHSAPALQVLAQAAALSRSPSVREPVRRLFALVDRLLGVYVRLPEELTDLDDQTLTSTIQRRHAEIDYYLHTAAHDSLAATFREAVADDPRLAWLESGLVGALDALRQTARRRLALRGVQRIQVTPGSPFGLHDIVPSGEPARSTADSRLDGRVAGVTPGNGGYRLNGRVVVPALAQAWRFDAAVDTSR